MIIFKDWYCQRCEKQGMIQGHPLGIEQLINIDHRKKSPFCKVHTLLPTYKEIQKRVKRYQL